MAAPAPAAVPASLGALDQLQAVWDLFRAGSTVACPTDAFPMALSVDGSVGAYRFVCTRCGTSSPWFESGAAGVVLRGTSMKAEPPEGG